MAVVSAVVFVAVFSQAVFLRLIWRLLDVEQVSDYPPAASPMLPGIHGMYFLFDVTNSLYS